MTERDRLLIDGILEREGGRMPWNRMPVRTLASDRGGPTRGGITAGAWGAHALSGRAATGAELAAVTEAQAREFYRARYLAPWDWAAEPLRGLCVDWAVTSWHDDPVRALQTSLRRRRLYLGPPDGVAGPLTRDALARCGDQRALYGEILAARIRHYVHVALSDAAARAALARPDAQLRHLRGWVARALRFLPAG